MPFARSLRLLAIALAVSVSVYAAPAIERVEVAPTKTSVYVGSVSMTMRAFNRRDGGFESTYVAKVFPYFFYNETGTLRIEFSDTMLADLQRGTPVEFQGHAQRTDGAGRHIEGKATPTDATTGKLKVRVRYSKRVELIFNTTYKLVLGSPPGHPPRPATP